MAPLSVQRPGSWGSIRAEGPPRSNITLRHVTLANGTSGVQGAHPGASVALEATWFTDLSVDGLHISEADAGTVVSVSDVAFQRVEGDGIEAAGPAGEHLGTVRNWQVERSGFESIGGDGIDVRGDTVRGLDIRTNRFADVGATRSGWERGLSVRPE